MTDEKLSFTGINYLPCNYCSHLMRGEHRDGYNQGCGQIKTDGKYARVTFGDESVPLSKQGIDSVNGLRGCEQFESSGVPAHPQVLEALVQQNPKCSTIPSDPNATETSWDFSDKINRHLPRKNIISYTQVQ